MYIRNRKENSQRFVPSLLSLVIHGGAINAAPVAAFVRFLERFFSSSSSSFLFLFLLLVTLLLCRNLRCSEISSRILVSDSVPTCIILAVVFVTLLIAAKNNVESHPCDSYCVCYGSSHHIPAAEAQAQAAGQQGHASARAAAGGALSDRRTALEERISCKSGKPGLFRRSSPELGFHPRVARWSEERHRSDSPWGLRPWGLRSNAFTKFVYDRRGQGP